MKKAKLITLIVLGVVSILLSIRCFTFSVTSTTEDTMYGGDAFTGIQNATAMTARNIDGLATVVQFGFGSVLLVAGLAFIGIALTTPVPHNTTSKVIDRRDEWQRNPATTEESNKEG